MFHRRLLGHVTQPSESRFVHRIDVGVAANAAVGDTWRVARITRCFPPVSAPDVRRQPGGRLHLRRPDVAAALPGVDPRGQHSPQRSSLVRSPALSLYVSRMQQGVLPRDTHTAPRTQCAPLLAAPHATIRAGVLAPPAGVERIRRGQYGGSRVVRRLGRDETCCRHVCDRVPQ